MKRIHLSKSIFRPATVLVCLGMLLPLSAVAVPNVDFTSPTNGEQVISLAGLSGTATGTDTVQQVTFSIQNLATGLWWDGTNFHASQVDLPTTLAGANWSPGTGVVLPAICCSASYQLAATATD